MVLSSSQQLVVAFTAVLLVFVVFPRMFSGGTRSKESRGFDPRLNRKGGPSPVPGAARAHQFNMNAPDSKGQTFESVQQMRKMMEQELKSDKYKSNNKGYVFTLMPLYAIGVGVFAVYKFLKIRSKDDSKGEKDKNSKRVKKSVETENQLSELEHRLAQTEKMLNSILNQLDPLTNCVKSVASEQKNEIMSQLQSIRHLMKKRGMDCPLVTTEELTCEKNLDDIIESLSAEESRRDPVHLEELEGPADEGPAEGSCPSAEAEEGVEELDSGDTVPSWEDTFGAAMDDESTPNRSLDMNSASGLRRRNRPE